MREITATQVLIFNLLLAVVLAASVGTTWLSLSALPLGDFRGVGFVLMVFVLIYVYACVIYRLYLYIFPIKEGEIAPGSREEFHYHIHLLFNLVLFHALTRSLLLPVPLMRLVYIALGARLGANSYSAGVLLDPALIWVGDNSIVGHDALIFSHVVEGSGLSIARVRLGNNVTIGAKAVIMPGVIIEDDAIVAVGAVVQKGTHIRAGELWGGVPARLIRNADKGHRTN